jgi:mannose-6-phosphate isomerase-like protein (cupin superfamily)
MPKVPTRSGRVFLREVSADGYSLAEERERRLARPRSRRATTAETGLQLPLSPDHSASKAWWVLSPADDEFLTQSLEVHFRELPPGEANTTHGHQNEALFYWLEGTGYDEHDGERFAWTAGDAVFVPVDTVHAHVNSSQQERAVAVVIKAKSAWMYLGLLSQGPVEPWSQEKAKGYGDRLDWAQMWTPGLAGGKTVIRCAELPWQVTEHALERDITSSNQTDHRNSSVDLAALRIPAGGWSSKHLHTADEVLFVLSGHGHVRQWDTRHEIADRYYARVSEEHTDWDFGPGDLVHVPTSTAHQIFADGGGQVELLSAKNRLFAALGYRGVLTLEPSSDMTAGS